MPLLLCYLLLYSSFLLIGPEKVRLTSAPGPVQDRSRGSPPAPVCDGRASQQWRDLEIGNMLQICVPWYDLKIRQQVIAVQTGGLGPWFVEK